MSMHEIYCCFLRDAISKGLYAQLFSWLVSRINQICFKEQKDSSIALLDIYGFEVCYFRIRRQLILHSDILAERGVELLM